MRNFPENNTITARQLIGRLCTISREADTETEHLQLSATIGDHSFNLTTDNFQVDDHGKLVIELPVPFGQTSNDRRAEQAWEDDLRSLHVLDLASLYGRIRRGASIMKMTCVPHQLLETLRTLVGGATSSLEEDDRELAEVLDSILALGDSQYPCEPNCDHAEWRTNSERYQYLRDFHVLPWVSQIGGPDTCSIDFEGEGHDLDNAIDKARGAE